MPSCYIQVSGRNCEIMLAGTAPYCSGHVILLCYRTPFYSYEIVTGTFPEHSWNPIYMHLCHIIFVSIYFRNLPNTLELQSDEWLISKELEVQYVLSWPDPFDYQKVRHLAT